MPVKPTKRTYCRPCYISALKQARDKGTEPRRILVRPSFSKCARCGSPGFVELTIPPLVEM